MQVIIHFIRHFTLTLNVPHYHVTIITQHQKINDQSFPFWFISEIRKKANLEIGPNVELHPYFLIQKGITTLSK